MLPLPPPPEDHPTTQHRKQYRIPTKDVTAEMPRLPEVEVHDEASEVRVDHRVLSPGRGSLTGARSISAPNVSPRRDPLPTVGTRTIQGTHAHLTPRNRPTAPE